MVEEVAASVFAVVQVVSPSTNLKVMVQAPQNTGPYTGHIRNAWTNFRSEFTGPK